MGEENCEVGYCAPGWVGERKERGGWKEEYGREALGTEGEFPGLQGA
jgi:hypothetical protein